MSAKHTPGPWHDNDTHDGEGPMAVWTSRSSGKFICCAQYPFPNSPRRDREEVSDDERVANIRLIAAAPELLEALRSCMEFLTAWSAEFAHSPENRRRAFAKQAEFARDIIAKAEGGAE